MKKLNEIEMRIKSIIESQNLAVSSDFVIDYWSSKGGGLKKAHPLNPLKWLYTYVTASMLLGCVRLMPCSRLSFNRLYH